MSTLKQNILYGAFAQALIATGGSLFLSEVMKFPPCVLCWYQRICMYPIVVLLAIGIYTKDKGVAKYVLPLSITGLGIAIYHNLLYYNILPESVAPCTMGISCTTVQLQLFGWITIPLLSLVAFAIITTLMLIYLRSSKK